MSFFISGEGGDNKRVAKSYDKSNGVGSPTLHIEYYVENVECTPEEVLENGASCYALSDDAHELYIVSVSPNRIPPPMASIIPIPEVFNGEGSAYRSSDNRLYVFNAKGDDEGPSSMSSINIATGEIGEVKIGIIPGLRRGCRVLL